MKIERKVIKVADLINGYRENGSDGIEGITAYGGQLDVRPPYQREFIYPDKDRDEVIRSVMKGFPINVMYWAKNIDGRYELMDGQQRTVSICRFTAENYQNFSVDYRYFFNLEEDERKNIKNYELDIYICEGTPSEILSWFRVINIAGMKLTEQELRNTAYTGPWLADAKVFFSKPFCTAYNIAKDYMTGKAIRQEYLERALNWITDSEKLSSIEDYMSLHQNDKNAHELTLYFKDVIHWVQNIFPVYRKDMKKVNWGFLYNRCKNNKYDPQELEVKISALMKDDDVGNKAGIYDYVLSGNESSLNIRAFSDSMKSSAYERQKGICPICKKHFAPEEMEADHIKPWCEGGKTIPENCQMLCKDCNRRKSNK